ncbi:hypothetical protein BB559_000035 [Furculomyces boomerangus]|uniref:RING-type domain-containing protein n=2 Tax=Harpellales TaxID=61421 RepID=A0A2T9Z6P1_9FUNG|nr:hypothetical protein BB559_000035 [Furculomyces boomerangus]PWA01376.1 hypothetical protein BB558_002533 [Smittium angustum]
MGNAQGKSFSASFDGGSLSPNGLYPKAEQDFDKKIVERLITERKISPFYQGAEDPENEKQDSIPQQNLQDFALPKPSDEIKHQIVFQDTNPENLEPHQPESKKLGNHSRKGSFFNRFKKGSLEEIAIRRSTFSTPDLQHSSKLSHSPITSKSHSDINSQLYSALSKRIIECPICFLYYPKNINYTACCKKPICTECFVQFKRSDKNTNLIECPYCLDKNFSVTYSPPPELVNLSKTKGHSSRGKSVSHITDPVLKLSASSHKRSTAAEEQQQSPQPQNFPSIFRNPYANLQISPEDRQLLRQYGANRSIQGLDDFILQEALAMSRDEIQNRPINDLIVNTSNISIDNDQPNTVNNIDTPNTINNETNSSPTTPAHQPFPKSSVNQLVVIPKEITSHLNTSSVAGA